MSKKLELAALAVCAVALALSAWAGGLVLSNDGPQHLLSAAAWASFSDPATRFSHVIGVVDTPTDRGVDELFSLLWPALDWRTAYRVVLVVICEVWALGFYAFAAALAGERAPRAAGFLGFPTAFHLPWALGVLPFSLALGLGFLTLAAHLRLRALPLRVIATAVLLYATARVHVLPAALAGVALVALALARGDDVRARALRVAEVVAAGLPAAAVAWQTAHDPLAHEAATLVWWPFADRALRSFLPGGSVRGAVAVVVAVVACAAAVAFDRGARRAVALLGALLVVVAWSLPRDVAGWQLAGVRVAPYGFMFCAAAFPFDALARRARTVATVVVALCVCGGLALAAADNARRREACAPALALLDAQRPDPRLLSEVILDLTCGLPEAAPNVTPTIYLASLYAVPRRTLSEFAQATSARLHPIAADPARYRGLRYVDPASWMRAGRLEGDARRRGVERAARALAHRPVLLVYGRPEDIALFRSLGYVAEQSTDRLLIAHFAGCSVRVDGAGAVDDSAPSAAGPASADETGRVAVGAVDDGEAWVVGAGPRVDGAPCGPVWIRAGGRRLSATLAPGADNVVHAP